jgi:GT2 family glycosyltransferase
VTVEAIIVDDSPEGSAEEPAGRFAMPGITYIKNPQPTGGVPSIVRNLGWPLARGRYVHFLDDDDVVPAGHYATVKRAFEQRTDVGLIFGGIEPFGTGPSAQLDRERRYFADAASKASRCERFGPRWAFVGRMLFDTALLVCSASVVRRQCLIKLGGFDPTIRLMEDADYHVRAMREFGAHFLTGTALHYRIGSPSLMHSPDPPASQRQEELAGRRRMQANYRRRRGMLEFYALAVFTRTLLRVL